MIALDLFAGTGWGVACQRLGIEEHGVEIMPEAIATREANGMSTIYHDVWEGLAGAHAVPEHDLLVASPPCQTFSMAGGGKGRKALDEVLGLIDSKAYRDVAALRAFGEKHDPRTALVLTPLAHVVRDVPTYVVFEQVPPVLPVWERCADEMRRWGYSVWTGVLNAEQYGVPQTRKRAILIARADGVEVAPPTPTHSAYYSRDRARLDPDVLPWVSMAEALGWGVTQRPYVTVAAGTSSGGTDPAYLGGSGARALVAAEREAGRWKLQSQYSTTPREGLTPPPGSKLPRVTREMHEPASTITSKFPHWVAAHAMGSGMVERHGRRPPRELDEPAFTIRASAGGMEPHGFRLEDLNETEGPIRISADEASLLQSYPAAFEWRGGKGAVAQQIGNAVPPLLAEAILKGFLA